MGQQKRVCRPRSLKIFETAFDNGITPSGQIHTTNYIKGDHLIHHKEWSGMVRGEKQSLACFGKVAAILKVDASTLYYGDAMIEPGDVAIGVLAGQVPSRLWEFLETILVDAPAHKYVGAVYHLVRQGTESFVSFRSTAETESKKWPTEDQPLVAEFFDLISAAIKQRTSPIDPPRRQGGLETLNEHSVPQGGVETFSAADAEPIFEAASVYLENTPGAKECLCDLLDVMMNHSLTTKMLVDNLLRDPDPLGRLRIAVLSKVNPDRGKFRTGLNETQRETIIRFRDYATCLVIPQEQLQNIQRQIKANEALIQVGTSDRPLIILHFARLMSVADYHAKAPDEEKRIIEQTSKQIIPVNLQKIMQSAQLPPDAGVSKGRMSAYVQNFIGGLAFELGIPGFDYDSDAAINAAIEAIGEKLVDWRNPAYQITIGVFVSEERGDDIKCLKDIFPEILFIQLPKIYNSAAYHRIDGRRNEIAATIDSVARRNR